MSESTFALTPVFGEQVFARFSKALSELKSDPKLAERIGIYSRVSHEDLATFLSSAFWASLSPEEGRYHGFRLSLGPPSPVGSDYSFTQPKTYSPDELATSRRSLPIAIGALEFGTPLPESCRYGELQISAIGT